MNEDSMRHGAFGWTELMTTDAEAAKQFYTALFGWETEEAPMEVMEGMEGMKYTVIKVDGDPVGGLTGMPHDVDATAGRVERLGGKLLRPPADIPNVGRFCVIQDPQGAALCAITYVKKEDE